MKRIKLKEIETAAPARDNKSDMKKELTILHKQLFSLQHLFHANASRSMLIVFQGMDTSGKDGTIRNVFSCVNPLGVHATAFREPCDKEKEHDFLWRIYQQLPEKGMIRIFNRSHYEDILVPTVHRLLDEELIERRYDYINSFEQQLEDSGTIILKFYLHISPEEQHERLSERMKNPGKMWKYNEKDFEEAKLWDIYMQMYQECFDNCKHPSWTIVPSDQNWYKEYIIASQLYTLLKGLDMQYPGLKK